MSRRPRQEPISDVPRERAVGEYVRTSNSDTVVVERWKASSLAQLVDAAGRPLRPRIEFGVSSGFVMIGLLAGLPFGASGPVLVTLGFVTLLLVPEFVRAILLRAWGGAPLVLATVGEACIETRGPRLPRARVALLAVVGPLTLLALAGMFAVGARNLPEPAAAVARAFSFSHVAWAGLQLIPFAPFAAGVALQARLRAPYAIAHQLFSIKLAVLGSLLVAKLFPAVFPLAMLTTSGAVRGFIRSYLTASDEKNGLPVQVRRAESLVADGDAGRALLLVRRALELVREPALRDRACKCLAWAAIGSGDARWAHVALAMLPSRELDVHLVASYLAVRKLDDQAIELLERARVEGQRSRETTKLLLDLLLLEGQQARAFDVARSDSALLASDEMALVAGRVFASTSRPNAQGAAREACADGGAKPVARR